MKDQHLPDVLYSRVFVVDGDVPLGAGELGRQLCSPADLVPATWGYECVRSPIDHSRVVFMRRGEEFHGQTSLPISPGGCGNMVKYCFMRVLMGGVVLYRNAWRRANHDNTLRRGSVRSRWGK